MLQSLIAILTTSALFYMLIGVVLGLIFGAIPGLTATLAVVLLIPITYTMDALGWSRGKAGVVNCVALMVLSLACVFGFILWSAFQPLGEGSTVLDFEDFILSNNIMPLGSVVFLLFCTRRYGWGWDAFYQETSLGKGLAYPRWARKYISYVLPLIVLAVFISGYVSFLTK